MKTVYFTLFLFLSVPPQSYTGQTGGSGGGGGGGGTSSGNGAGDEDYEIPPITPPNHPEPPLLHLMEHESTGYLGHSLSHNGLINPYSYPELPTLMMSNMLGQDSHLVSSQMPSVSSAHLITVRKILNTWEWWVLVLILNLTCSGSCLKEEMQIMKQAMSTHRMKWWWSKLFLSF